MGFVTINVAVNGMAGASLEKLGGSGGDNAIGEDDDSILRT